MIDELVKRFNDVDPRTTTWLLVDNPKTTFGILLSYLLWIKVVGPKFMENRKPYDLKSIVNIYNVLQVIFCGYLFVKLLKNGAFVNIWECVGTSRSIDSEAMNLAEAVHQSFLLKLVDLIETIMFTLRKKWGQVSFLHVYHHSVTYTYIWFASRYYPGGHFGQVVGINNFIHCIMYTYYLYSANASFRHRQNNEILKKIVTLSQLIQFYFLIFWASQIFFVERCSTDLIPALMSIPYVASLIYLFTEFYIKTYHGKVSKS